MALRLSLGRLALQARLVPIPGLGSTKKLFEGALQVVMRPSGRFDSRVEVAYDEGEALAFTSKTTAEAAKKVLALGTAETPVVPIGLSYGGYITLEVLRQALEERKNGNAVHLAGICLMDTQCRADAPEQKEGRLKMIADAKENLDGPLEALLPKFLAPENIKRLGEETKAMGREAGAESFSNQIEGIMSRVDTSAAVEALRHEWPELPVLIMCGLEDALTPLQKHEEMCHLAGMTSAQNNAIGSPRRFVFIRRAGHFMPWERPAECGLVIYHWLKDSHIISLLKD